jgi:acyl-[acyl-carrier-protein] desaturase
MVGHNGFVNGRSEENRHGDLLNKYLYLSGRVNMRELKWQPPYQWWFWYWYWKRSYKNFVYTSFQISYLCFSQQSVTVSESYGDKIMCKMIAGDEMRHHHAYSEFVNKFSK